MGSYLKIDEVEFCSKSTSSFIESVIHEVVGPPLKTVNEDVMWCLTKRDVAAIVMHIQSMLLDQKEFYEFAKRFSDRIWVTSHTQTEFQILITHLKNYVVPNLTNIALKMTVEDRPVVVATWI